MKVVNFKLLLLLSRPSRKRIWLRTPFCAVHAQKPDAVGHPTGTL